MRPPKTPLRRVRRLAAALPFFSVPALLLVGASVVVMSLRDGDGSGRMTGLILVVGTIGLLFAILVLISLLRLFKPAEWLEGQAGKTLREIASAAGSDVFAAVYLALYEQWGGGSRPRAVDPDPQLEFLAHRLGKGPALIAAIAEPMPVLGILGTCLSLIHYLRGTIRALTSAEKVGLELIQELGATLEVLPSAFESTIAGIVMGPLLLRGMAAALQRIVMDLVYRFESVLRIYVLPLMSEEDPDA